jgi:predicted Zn-dependent peptidase
MNIEHYQQHTFSNGIRLIHRQVSHTRIAHCGFALNIGSRDETPSQLGIAHFWEHMAFKGTKKRKAYHILNRLDALGGELNAFTSKEQIFFYASILEEHFEKAADLLTDITFHSVFPEKEIWKERGVILEEMAMYRDNPAESIDDDFDSLIFGSHPLGQPVLGTPESVASFGRSDFEQFIAQHLNTKELVFVSVSCLPFEKVKRTLERYLEEVPALSGSLERELPKPLPAQRLEERKPSLSQANGVIGRATYSFYDKKRLPFVLLMNLLGGSGMNTRLNLTLREKHGLVYAVEASSSFFSDSGIFAINFATDKKTLDKTLHLIERELEKLRHQKLGTLQLHSAKQQLKGQLAMSAESNSGLMLTMGKYFLMQQQMPTWKQTFDAIDAITAEQLLEIAQEQFAPDSLSTLVYVPEN